MMNRKVWLRRLSVFFGVSVVAMLIEVVLLLIRGDLTDPLSAGLWVVILLIGGVSLLPALGLASLVGSRTSTTDNIVVSLFCVVIEGVVLFYGFAFGALAVEMNKWNVIHFAFRAVEPTVELVRSHGDPGCRTGEETPFPVGKTAWYPSFRCVPASDTKLQEVSRRLREMPEPWQKLGHRSLKIDRRMQVRYESDGKQAFVSFRFDIDCDGRFSHARYVVRCDPTVKKAITRALDGEYEYGK